MRNLILIMVLAVVYALCISIFFITIQELQFEVSAPVGIIIAIVIICVMVTITVFIWEKLKKITKEEAENVKRKNNMIFKKENDIAKESDEYYRDILRINSPTLLGYLNLNKIDKKLWIAELLYMYQQDLIDIENERLTIKSKAIEEPITDIQKFLLSKISDEGYLEIDKLENFENELKQLVIKTAKEHKLIHVSKVENVGSAICAIFIPIIISYLVGNILIWLLGFPYMFIFSNNFYNVVKITKEGKIINKNLEGLKNYIRDFSLLSEKESDEVELWKEYLIYAVMFGYNEKIIEEYEKYIKIKK